MSSPTMTGIALVEAEFRAMGSACRIVCDLDEQTLFDAVHRIEDLECRWSRFRPDSEISRCNRAAGVAVAVSAVTEQLVRLAVDASRLTAGRFNPLMLRELEAAGYDRSFELLDRRARRGVLSEGEAVCVDDLVVGDGQVTIPVGAGFDPGGLGKGFAADLVAEELIERGARWVVVSLGGDMRLTGEALEEQLRPILIEDPRRPSRAIGAIERRGGAVATSTVGRRRWSDARHHLLDPSTGVPARTRRTAVTVASAEAWWADVVAKCLVVDPALGSEDLASWNTEAVALDEDGVVEPLGLALVEGAGAR